MNRKRCRFRVIKLYKQTDRTGAFRSLQNQREGSYAVIGAVIVPTLLSALSANAGFLYVADGGGDAIQRVGLDGSVSGFTSNNVYNPRGLAIDSYGNLYVANENKTIEKFTPGGVGSVFVSSMPSVPTGLAFDRQGNLYVAILDANTIEKFSSDGTGSIFATNGLNRPTGLTFDAYGNLFVANQGDNTIEKFTPEGVGSLFATNLDYPLGLAFSPSGQLYVANYNESTIDSFDELGVRSGFAQVASPYGLTFDDAGNLYASSDGSDGSSVFKISTTGTASELADTRPAYNTYLLYVPEPSVVSMGSMSVLIFAFRKLKDRN